MLLTAGDQSSGRADSYAVGLGSNEGGAIDVDEGTPIAAWNEDTRRVSWTSLGTAFVMATTPLWLMALALGQVESAIAALLLFNLGVCLGLPAVYCMVWPDHRKVRPTNTTVHGTAVTPPPLALPPHAHALHIPTAIQSIVEYGRAKCSNTTKQLKLGVVGLAGTFGGGVGVYYLARPLLSFPPGMAEKAAAMGMVGPTSGSTLFVFVWLSLFNPFAEEFFWRVFLQQAFEHGGLGRTWCNQGAVQLLYASYHAVVLAFFADPVIVAVATLALVGAGGVFALVTHKVGSVAAALVHAGGDMAICVAAADLLWDIL
jgi:membrane protease YdiL (CAAX protease family)